MKSKEGKKSGKKAEPVKAKPVKKDESSDSDDSSSEEEQPKVVKTSQAKPTKVAKVAAMEVDEGSSDDSSESDEQPAVTASQSKKTATPAAKAQKKESESSEESSDEESNIPAKAVATPKGAAVQTPQSKNTTKKAESSSEEEDDSSEEESAPAPVTKGKMATSTPVTKKPKEASSSEEEESSDEEEDESEEAAPNGAIASTNDDDEDDDDDDEEEEAPKPGQKRKAKAVETPAKKAKVEIDETKGLELFVKGLPEGCQEKKLTKFFAKHGAKVESIKLISGKNIGFIKLTEEISSSDVAKINGQELDGSSLAVEIARNKGNSDSTPKGSKGGDRAEKDKRTLFVRNLPWGTDEDALGEHFEGCEEVRLPRNDDGKLRGIAFVQFASEDEALKVMKELNNTDFGGRTLAVSQAGHFDGNNSFGGNQQSNRNSSEKDKRSLFVGNLSWGVDENAISELFEGCAEVRVPKRDDGKIKGFAFVEYSSEAEAVKAMENFQGSELDGRSISIERCSEKQSQGRGGGRGGRGGRGGFDRGGRGGGGFGRGGPAVMATLR